MTTQVLSVLLEFILPRMPRITRLISELLPQHTDKSSKFDLLRRWPVQSFFIQKLWSALITSKKNLLAHRTSTMIRPCLIVSAQQPLDKCLKWLSHCSLWLGIKSRPVSPVDSIVTTAVLMISITRRSHFSPSALKSLWRSKNWGVKKGKENRMICYRRGSIWYGRSNPPCQGRSTVVTSIRMGFGRMQEFSQRRLASINNWSHDRTLWSQASCRRPSSISWWQDTRGAWAESKTGKLQTL